MLGRASGFAAWASVSLLAVPARTAKAQGLHDHGGGYFLPPEEIAAGVAHALTLGSLAFLVGLSVFAVLVWRPVSGFAVGVGGARAFSASMWLLFGALAAAGLLEVSVYSVRASGRPYGTGLLGEALFETRLGHIWLLRVGLAFCAVLAAYAAVRRGKRLFWWSSVGCGIAALGTLALTGHAAAQPGWLPSVAIWAHVAAASAWAGGLLAFPILLLGPLREMSSEDRRKLLWVLVGRFTRVATISVAVLVASGAYAALTYVPDIAALTGTPYGRALLLKLGLVTILLGVGAVNMLDRGGGPFGQMVGAELLLALGVLLATGFLTTQPPPVP